MEETPKRILVVDDEASICELMKINLEIAGYAVDEANSAEMALEKNLTTYSLIVLGIMMGEMSGLDLVSRLRANASTSQIPIILCTALGDDQPLVDGFNRGADDYIRKPFSMRELVARVGRLLRKTPYSTIVEYEDLRLDNTDKSCTLEGAPVTLTKKEYDLLHFLMTNRGKIFSREEILDAVWEKNVYVVDRTIDVNINRLRKKLGKYESSIITRQGYGYGFKENL